MLELLAVSSKKHVAQHYGLSMDGLDSWLTRIRAWRKDYQWFLNKLLNIERGNPRLRKILLSASEEDLDLFEGPIE